MPPISDTKLRQNEKLTEAILKTLAFFSLYGLPMSAKRTWELLLDCQASVEEVQRELNDLALSRKIVQMGNYYSLHSQNFSQYQSNQLEMVKKWQKIDRYFNWLAVLPFVRNISVINSLALGTADSDSDIDFFVVTNKGKLYFVRSVIIVLFKLLGVYKTRQKIKDRFCFGFFADTENLAFRKIMLQPFDPYFVFWLANMRPVLGGKAYWQLVSANQWLTQYFPNFQPMQRLTSAKKPGKIIQALKIVLEIFLWLPATLAEPILRRIHINHTFKLAENRSVTSTTIANAGMLKLHGYDVRAEIAQRFEGVLNN